MSTDWSINNVFDTYTEYGWRKVHTYVQTQLLAAGFVATTDVGQLATPAVAYAWFQNGDGTQANGTVPPGTMSNMFDGNTGTNWATGKAPAVGNGSFNIYFDLGLGNSNTAATYKIYMLGASGDPATWTLQGSNDLATWTILDTQTGISVVAGYQTYTVSSPAAFRYHRLVITASRLAGSLIMTEWQLITAGAVNFCTPTFNTAVGAAVTTLMGYEIYRFADTLQSTAPVFFKVEYWSWAQNSVNCGVPQMFFTFGTATDGYGNIIGSGISQRVLSSGWGTTTQPTFPNLLTPNGRHLCSGSGGKRFSCALAYNHSVLATWFSFERIKDNTGADTSLGVTWFSGGTATGSAAQYSMVMAAAGGSPAAEAVSSVLAPNAANPMGSGGGVVAFYEMIPIMGPRLPSPIGILMYFTSNIAQEAPVVVPMYGTNHTYVPLATTINSPTATRGVTGLSIAMLYE